MEDCVFCKILKGEIKKDFILENDGAISFLDVKPIVLGHSLVIFKKHYQNILEVENEKEIIDFFNCLKKTVKILEKVLKCDGFNIGVNHNKAGGQFVSHIHFHILPRWFNDGGGSIHSIVNNPNKDEMSLEDLQKLINDVKINL